MFPDDLSASALAFADAEGSEPEGSLFGSVEDDAEVDCEEKDQSREL